MPTATATPIHFVKLVTFEAISVLDTNLGDINEFLKGTGYVFSQHSTRWGVLKGILHAEGTSPSDSSRKFVTEDTPYLVKRDGNLLMPANAEWFEKQGIPL